MKSIGFIISHKENEKRRALVPEHIQFIKHPEFIFIEDGYGKVLGYKNQDYTQYGVKVASREDILKKDIICDPKIGDGEYLDVLSEQTIFGWIHAVQNKNIADKLVEKHLTAYAWEDMYESGRHVFWRNNEIAGEAAIMHAYLLHGVFPYNTKVAILGRGNTARGAMKTLNYLGAHFVTYDRRTESLFRKEIGNYDVIVNAILWDTKRTDHIICREDLRRMKKGAMIIDISCDKHGGVETSVPTTIEQPDYFVDGIRHYVVDHTPSLFYKTTSEELSCEVVKYIDLFIEDNTSNNDILKSSLIIENGIIKDKRIIDFQKTHEE